MENRLNQELAAVVIKGLIASSTLALPALIEKMKSKGVPHDVIERVFIAPRIHRADDIDTSVGVM